MATDYTLNWSDDNLKTPFTLAGGSVNTTTTSLQLTGKGAVNWGEKLQENLIRLLENFASNAMSPNAPTIGQLWFDASTNQLKIWYANEWHDLAKRRIDSATAPTGVLFKGDLWYDTTNNLLKVYTNNNTWVAVCSQCSGGGGVEAPSTPGILTDWNGTIIGYALEALDALNPADYVQLTRSDSTSIGYLKIVAGDGMTTTISDPNGNLIGYAFPP